MDAQGRGWQKLPKIRGSIIDAGYCQAESTIPDISSDGTCPHSSIAFRPNWEEKQNQQLELDTGASRGYRFDHLAIVIHQARFDQRSVGSLKSAIKGAEAGTCGRSLITRRSLVRVQPPLP